MIEVHPRLFVGNECDGRAAVGQDGWFVVHACKEPYHRAALGYASPAAPKGSPEYLFARRPGCLALNLIDAPTPALIPAVVIDAGIEAIATNLPTANVLVHCNQGVSRSPMIALLYLAQHTSLFDDCTYDQAVARFTAVYPSFKPNGGMAGYARKVFAGI